MEFAFKQPVLQNALQRITGVIEKNQTLQLLNNVLIEFKGTEAIFTGTDLEVELTCHASLLEKTDSAAITIPAKKLFDIVKSLPNDADISLKQEGQQIIIKCNKSRFKLHTLPADEFPRINYEKPLNEFQLLPNQIRYLIEKVYFSMAQQDVRYYLNGLLLELTLTHIRTVATDGHRLAMATLEQGISVDQVQRYILPRKGVVELLRILPNDETVVDIQFGANYARITGGNFSYITKLIDGKFPNYETVIPKKADKKIIVDRSTFKQMLQCTAVLSNEKLHGAQFSLSKDKLVVQTRNNAEEYAEDEYRIEYSGEDFEVAFNIHYVLEALSAIQTKDAEIEFSKDNHGVMINGVNDANAIYVIMPMRI